MPVTKNLYDGKYISLYEENNFRVFVKMSEYQSVIDPSNVYDLITNIKIVDTEKQEIIYSRDNISMPYNKEGLISIVNYIDKVIFYLKHEETDIFWKRLFLDKLFVDMNTLKIELYYNRAMKQIKEEEERQRVNEYREHLEQLQEQIRIEYNKKGIAVFYNIFNMYFINDSRVIFSQKDNHKMIEQIEKYKEMYKPFILKHVKLNWTESDIPILNKLAIEENLLSA